MINWNELIHLCYRISIGWTNAWNLYPISRQQHSFFRLSNGQFSCAPTIRQQRVFFRFLGLAEKKVENLFNEICDHSQNGSGRVLYTFLQSVSILLINQNIFTELESLIIGTVRARWEIRNSAETYKGQWKTHDVHEWQKQSDENKKKMKSKMWEPYLFQGIYRLLCGYENKKKCEIYLFLDVIKWGRFHEHALYTQLAFREDIFSLSLFLYLPSIFTVIIFLFLRCFFFWWIFFPLAALLIQDCILRSEKER